ncbi:MAG: zinc-ribbon domain-containing protein [Acidobacteriaceae bacterium]|nr:zinc-ribbon domain-containing protein [Acidobacteriaceae bacterium]
MHCPNCGLENQPAAKFCANCGTSFANAKPSSAASQQSQSQYQAASSYPTPSAPYRASNGRSLGKNIAFGCLIAVVIFLIFSISCTRACFGWRHGRYSIHRHYY